MMQYKPIILKIYLSVLLSIASVVCAFANPGFENKPIQNIFSALFNYPPPSITNLTICNNQLPYVWNNINCLAAGTYTATLVSSTGTDSVAELHLSVISVGISITNAIVCDNALPYIWNGNAYTASGTYSVTLTSSSGCDSVPILSLTINRFVTSTTSKIICSNLLPYNWNGNSYVAAGAYSATLRSAAGCDSIANLVLTVKPVATSTTAITVCSNQLPYTWNGRNYTVAGIYPITLIAANGCDSVAKLDLKINPTASSITRVTVCTNQLPYSWNGNAYNAAGTYPVTFRSYLNCDSIANLILAVLPVKTSTTIVSICTAQLPYSWNGNSYAIDGTYSVTLTGSNGCDSIATLQLSSAVFLSSTTRHSVCISDLPYTWNGNNYSSAGTYTASFVTGTGCDSVATLNLRVITPYLATDSLYMCFDLLPFNYHGHILTADGDYAMVPPVYIDACRSIDSVHLLTHKIPPGITITSVCNNQLPYIWNGHSYTLPGHYSITLTTADGCDSTSSLDLSINPLWVKDTSIKICSNQLPFSFAGRLYGASGDFIVRLISSAGCDSVITLHLTVNPVKSSATAVAICPAQVPYNWNGNNYSTSGTYNITLTSSGGCDSVASLHLFVQPFLTSTTNITVCNNQLPYTWNGNSYTTAGSYSVTIVTSAGCDSIATLNFAINNVIRSTTDVNTCTNQLPYIWNGNSYPVAGTYAVTLLTASGCDSVATLNLHVGSPVTSTTNLTICNNQLPYTWNGNVFPIAGSFPVTLISSSGCDSVATLNLEVKAILTSTTNVNVCTNQLPYIWSGNSYTSGGTYSVTLRTAAGCDSVPILILNIVPYVTSTTDLTICNNQLPYTWNGNIYTAAGTYSVLLTGLSVCDSLAILNLTVMAPIISTTNISICPSQLPYNWNGHIYTTGGTYTSVFNNGDGCDSTATLNLNIRTIATSSNTVTICNSQLPYTWNGHTYSSGGTYTTTLAGSNTCDSVATLKLIVHTATTSNTQRSICVNQLPYIWNGNTYSAPGIYIATLTNSNNCDSVATLKLIVNATVRTTTVVTKCSNQLPYTWNGHIYSLPGIYSDTLRSSTGCDSIVSLQLVVNAISVSNTTITVCSTALPYVWNGNNYSVAGMYTATLINSNGCDSVATLHLVVHSVSTSSTTATTCTNQLPYLWNGQQYSATGNYAVTLRNAAGCDSTATLQLTVNSLSSSTTAASTCSAQLPYSWNGQNYTTAGLHIITLTSAAGCDSITTLNLTINPTPLAPATLPVTYCQYDPTTILTAAVTSPGSSLLWYNSASGGVGTRSSPLPSSGIAGATTYYVSQVNGHCEGPRETLTVTVNSKPVAGPDKNIKVCFGDSLNLTLLYNTNGNSFNWTFQQQPVLFPDSVRLPGLYQLVLQSNFGCLDTSLVNLGILPKLFANAGVDDNAEYNAPYQLAGMGNGDFEWFPSGLLNDPFIANPVAILTSDQLFILTVKNELGCTATDSVKLRVLKGPTFYIPSAFTPNGDGHNDIFMPTAIGIVRLEYFRIFNRYGEKVYETSIINQGWDGIYKGVKQNIGNYVWMLRGTDRFGQLKMMKGNVVLIR